MQPSRVLARLLALLLALAGLAVVGTAVPSAHATTPKADGGGRDKQAALADLTLSGTVTTEDGGPLDAWVSLYQWQSGADLFEPIDGAPVADEPGSPSYSFSVAPGSYYVAVEDTTGGAYLTGYSGSATEPPTGLDSNGVVTVSDSSRTADVVLALAPTAQTVSGSVVDGSGDPVSDAYVETSAGPGYDDDTTDVDGAFSLTLVPGSYQLWVQAPVEFEDTLVDIVVDADGGVLEPIVLDPAGQWTVSGKVRDADGPLADAEVQVVQLIPDGEGGWYDGDWVADAVTGPDGTFAAEGIRSGDEYTVRASATGHGTRYAGNVASLDAAGLEHVHLAGDHTFSDITLPEASTLGGTVTGPNGPESETQVALYAWDETAGAFVRQDSAFTDDSGVYAFSSIEAGTYTLHFEPAEASSAAAAWLVGADMPSGPAAPGTFVVSSVPAALTKDKVLAQAQVATGRITDQMHNPLSDGGVVAYRWDADAVEWQQVGTATTGAQGTYAVRLPAAGDTVTFRFSRGGFSARFLGGGTSLPAAPNGTNSRVVPASGDLALPDAELPPFVSQLGKVAGQDDLAYCRANVLPANDDGSSDEVELPFDVKFYGNPFSSLYVNNNGNVTFGSPQSEYTPSALNGPTAVPIIAPFFADVDTTGTGSNVVTYGASADGKSFCVNWADVGYYESHDDKLNTFQLILTSRTGASGRTAGDFDVRFNYDEVLWETGDASDGANGLGGTSAAAGFSAGTGAPGSYVQLEGSLVNGALLDAGPHALVASSQNSAQPGRYNFEIRNDGFQPTLGGLTGHVQKVGGAPVVGAYVEACRTGTYQCSYTDTNASGDYAFTALNAGSYAVEVWPPDNTLFSGGTTASVTTGDTTTAPVVILQAPVPMPDNVQLNGAGADGSVPSVYYGDPVHLRIMGCEGVSTPTYTVALTTGQVLRNSLPLTLTAPGVYEADIAPFSPDHGDAVITTNVPKTCGGPGTSFNIYIDPAGVVTDQWGRPLDGATVTLYRAEEATGPFDVVPNGSDIMSASNQSNPDTTGADGMFQWDVQAGFYKVKAAATGCTQFTTDAMQIAPARTHLVLKLQCSAGAPTAAGSPTITGVPQVGRTITAVDTSWPAPLTSTVELVRNGQPLGAAAYTLKAGDEGAVFTARSSARRPSLQSDDGPDAGQLNRTVAFEVVTANSVTGLAAPLAATTTTLTGKKKAKVGSRPVVTVTVAAPGVVPAGTVIVRIGSKVVGTAVLVGGVAKVKLKKLKKKGKVTLVATYTGSATTTGSTSAPFKVKVR
ncbi:carboxypeptidase regulatory-like domain-containing protein [Nocardioides sp. QY071]|uniref:carboxypeptidase regulatory-like domain-containing protein n=1 Tax=Nocardioides sp. QY071 TaxID=3044187 RepID=UPI00249C69C1|nr:carboxypeptidase regulatory-like domain-containing protein [Nocardioides sp. QY071]WGY00762.1 carboxypeptidase regulatory-like domain-containing protein [Nocardioides sp. QY071]